MSRRILVNPCSIDGCDGLASSRGLCGKHYHRWQRHGDPLKTLYVMDDVQERFWSKVNKNGPIPDYAPELGNCWIWTPPPNKWGYGQFHYEKKTHRAHRLSYEWAMGSVPPRLQLDHLCRVRNCVRPSHLEPVTQRENVLRGIAPTAINAKKTECPKGHPLSGKNLIRKQPGKGKPDGGRECRTCSNEIKRAAWHRNKEKLSV